MRYFTTSIWKCLVVLALSPCLLALVGCDSSGSAGRTGAVKGKVTYNAQALPAGCTIVFVHEEKAIPASTAIAADGSYTLLMNGKPEIPVGTYKISVSPPAKDAAAAADPSNPEAYKAVMMGKKAAPGEQKGPFPQKYLSAETSKLTFTVKEGSNTYDLDMKDGT